jgi:hypothetical protein
MNIPNLSLTGKKEKRMDRWYPEVYCSLCNKSKYVKAQDLLKMKCCPVCRGLGTIEYRIKNRMELDKQSGCLIWTGCLNKDGYAIIADKKKRIRVAKLLLEQKLSRRLKENHETCHTCNNRKCVNTEHLYEGTHKQNGLDMAKRGCLRGLFAKTSKETAVKIKLMIKDGRSSKEIQKSLNVSKTVVSNIKYGICWAWL